MTDGTGGYGPRHTDTAYGSVPKILGNRYELAQQIGRGGMAEVYAGRDTRLGRTVAVKVLKTDLARDPSFQSRFKREAQSAASLNHPAIVAVYDTGDEEMSESNGSVTHLPFIVMEYLRGRTLKEVLAQHQKLSPDDALRVTAGVLDALQYSHTNGIVHRDIKPANVMVTDAGEIKVMDFGIARAIADTGATMTGTNAVLGTAQYLSPEQAKGETVDNRSDLYSTACLLYELLTGRPPFVGDSPVSLAYQHVGEQAPPPSSLVAGLPPDMDRVVMRGLSKSRDERYQSAEEFIADLDRVANGLPVAAVAAPTQAMRAPAPPPAQTTQRMAPAVAPPPAAWPREEPRYAPAPYDDYADDPPRRGLMWLWIVLGVLALAAIIALAVVLTSGDEPAPGPTNSVAPTSAPATTSAPPTAAAIVDVRGQPVAQARATLAGLGFTTIREEPVDATDDQVPGTVVEQSPAPDPNVQVSLTTEIILTVAQEPDAVAVPNVAGVSLAEARTALTEAGFEIGDTPEEDNPTVGRGLVIRTDPAIGSAQPAGSTITIVLATGQNGVPDVVGLDSAAAAQQLAEAGFEVEQEFEQSSEPAGRVLEQDPADGREDIGSTVRLLVSSGAQTTATPTTPTTSTTTSTTPAP